MEALPLRTHYRKGVFHLSIIWVPAQVPNPLFAERITMNSSISGKSRRTSFNWVVIVPILLCLMVLAFFTSTAASPALAAGRPPTATPVPPTATPSGGGGG